MDDLPESLIAIQLAQSGVISRSQALASGLHAHDIRRLLRSRRWASVSPGVYVDHTGQLTWLQRALAAVCATAPSALAGASAVRAHEGPGRADAEDGPITVAVDRGRHLVAPPGVLVSRRARLKDAAQWNLSPPRLRYEEAIVDLAVVAETPFEALELLSRAVQGRRTTARRLATVIRARPRARHRLWMLQVLTDLAEGSQSVLEHGYLSRVERAHGLTGARRQVGATTSRGAIRRDVEYDGGLVVELDGRLFHDSTRARDRDFDRDLDAAVDGKESVRLSWGQVFERPCWTAGRLAFLLHAGGWSGSPRPCGPQCAIQTALCG